MNPGERLCVAVLATDPGDRVLLVDSNKGEDRGWELPGGKREDGEPARLAAIREVAEETGLVVMLDEGEPVTLLFRGRAEGAPRAGSDAKDAHWWTRADVRALAQSGMLSDLATRDVLLAWAREPAPPPDPLAEHLGASADREEVAHVAAAADLVQEMIDRLTRDAERFAAEERSHVSDARIRIDALKMHSKALARLLTMARDLAAEGRHEDAVKAMRADVLAGSAS